MPSRAGGGVSTYLPRSSNSSISWRSTSTAISGARRKARFVSQSTLSAGIRELESLLGVTLVERSRRVVRFTPLGNSVVAKAHRLLREAEELADLVTSVGQTARGRTADERDPDDRAVPAAAHPARGCGESARSSSCSCARRPSAGRDRDRSTTGAPIACCWRSPSRPAKSSGGDRPTTRSTSPSPRTIRAIRPPTIPPSMIDEGRPAAAGGRPLPQGARPRRLQPRRAARSASDDRHHHCTRWCRWSIMAWA